MTWPRSDCPRGISPIDLLQDDFPEATSHGPPLTRASTRARPLPVSAATPWMVIGSDVNTAPEGGEVMATVGGTVSGGAAEIVVNASGTDSPLSRKPRMR